MVIKTKRGRVKKIKCWSCHAPLETNDNFLNKECPHCKALYANKPLNEAKLSILQDKYLEQRDPKLLNQMMKYIHDIVYNLICSKLKASGKYLEEEDVLDKVQWTLLKMTYYYTKPDFKISTSFTEYLSQVVLYPLYNYKQKKMDSVEISIFTPIKGSNSKGEVENKTLLDKLQEQPYLDGNCEVENYLFAEIEKENTINQVQDFVHSFVTIAEKKKGFSTALKLLLLYKHYFNKEPPKFFNEWWKKEGTEMRDYFEKSLTVLRSVLYESAKG